MSEIPDDIDRAAWDVAAACDDDFYGLRIYEAAARAIMAERTAATKLERERCAKIAEAKLYEEWSAAAVNVGPIIAAAIRTPSTGEEM